MRSPTRSRWLHRRPRYLLSPQPHTPKLKQLTQFIPPGDRGNLAVFVGWFEGTDDWRTSTNANSKPSDPDPKHSDKCESSAGRKDVTGKLSQGASSSGEDLSSGVSSGFTYGTSRTSTPDSIAQCPDFKAPGMCMALQAPDLTALDEMLQSPPRTEVESKFDSQTAGYCRSNSACCSAYECVSQVVKSVAVIFGSSSSKGDEGFLAGICQMALGTIAEIGISGRKLDLPRNEGGSKKCFCHPGLVHGSCCLS